MAHPASADGGARLREASAALGRVLKKGVFAAPARDAAQATAARQRAQELADAAAVAAASSGDGGAAPAMSDELTKKLDRNISALGQALAELDAPMQAAARQPPVAEVAAQQLMAAALAIKACTQLASHVDLADSAVVRLAGAAGLLVGSGRRLLLQAALRGGGGGSCSTHAAAELAQAQLEAMASLLDVLGGYEDEFSQAVLDATMGPEARKQLLPWLLAAATALAPPRADAAEHVGAHRAFAAVCRLLMPLPVEQRILQPQTNCRGTQQLVAVLLRGLLLEASREDGGSLEAAYNLAFSLCEDVLTDSALKLQLAAEPDRLRVVRAGVQAATWLLSAMPAQPSPAASETYRHHATAARFVSMLLHGLPGSQRKINPMQSRSPAELQEAAAAVVPLVPRACASLAMLAAAADVAPRALLKSLVSWVDVILNTAHVVEVCNSRQLQDWAAAGCSALALLPVASRLTALPTTAEQAAAEQEANMGPLYWDRASMLIQRCFGNWRHACRMTCEYAIAQRKAAAGGTGGGSSSALPTAAVDSLWQLHSRSCRAVHHLLHAKPPATTEESGVGSHYDPGFLCLGPWLEL